MGLDFHYAARCFVCCITKHPVLNFKSSSTSSNTTNSDDTVAVLCSDCFVVVARIGSLVQHQWVPASVGPAPLIIMKRVPSSGQTHEERAANLRRRAVESETRAEFAKVNAVMKQHPDSLKHVIQTLEDLGYMDRETSNTTTKSKQMISIESRTRLKAKVKKDTLRVEKDNPGALPAGKKDVGGSHGAAVDGEGGPPAAHSDLQHAELEGGISEIRPCGNEDHLAPAAGTLCRHGWGLGHP